jgi:hypothetical protein
VSAREDRPALIIQAPRGGAVARGLASEPPSPVDDGEVVLEVLEADAAGALVAPPAGEVVLSVPSPESFRREPEELARVLRLARGGVEPLVIEVEAAEFVREDELAVVVRAAREAPRPVILRIIRDG